VVEGELEDIVQYEGDAFGRTEPLQQVSVLKNGRAKAVRFSTLDAMCRVLDCQPGDLLEWVAE
jgi:Cro/C1-type HTH DNA-binding domain